MSDKKIAAARRLLLSDMRDEFIVGEKFDKWTVVELIGAGGHGQVFKAVDDEGHEVALKILDMEGRSEQARAEPTHRFENEVRLRKSLGLSHERLVPLLDHGECRGKKYFVMPLSGVSLNAYVDELKDPLSDRDIAEIILHVAEALKHLDSRHIVHRDVKPGNILIRDDGPKRSTWITDLSIAKSSRSSDCFTATNSAPATVDWAAPEQLTSKSATHQSDLYSLGGVLYYLLTGTQPHSYESDIHSKRAKLLRSEPFFSFACQSPLIPIAKKLLQRVPGRRYQHADELIADLNCFLDSQPLEHAPTTRTFNPIGALATAVEVLLFVYRERLVACVLSFFLVVVASKWYLEPQAVAATTSAQVVERILDTEQSPLIMDKKVREAVERVRAGQLEDLVHVLEAKGDAAVRECAAQEMMKRSSKYSTEAECKESLAFVDHAIRLLREVNASLPTRLQAQLKRLMLKGRDLEFRRPHLRDEYVGELEKLIDICSSVLSMHNSSNKSQQSVDLRAAIGALRGELRTKLVGVFFRSNRVADSDLVVSALNDLQDAIAVLDANRNSCHRGACHLALACLTYYEREVGQDRNLGIGISIHHAKEACKAMLLIDADGELCNGPRPPDSNGSDEFNRGVEEASGCVLSDLQANALNTLAHLILEDPMSTARECRLAHEYIRKAYRFAPRDYNGNAPAMIGFTRADSLDRQGKHESATKLREHIEAAAG